MADATLTTQLGACTILVPLTGTGVWQNWVTFERHAQLLPFLKTCFLVFPGLNKRWFPQDVCGYN